MNVFTATKSFADEVRRTEDLKEGERTLSLPKKAVGIKEPAAPGAGHYAIKPLKGVYVEYVYRHNDRLWAWLSDGRGVAISGGDGSMQDNWCVVY